VPGTTREHPYEPATALQRTRPARSRLPPRSGQLLLAGHSRPAALETRGRHAAHRLPEPAAAGLPRL